MLLVLGCLAFMPVASAQVYTQATIDTLNFNTINLNYRFDYIYIDQNDLGDFVLFTTVLYDDIQPFEFNATTGEIRYLYREQQVYFEYNDPDFFQCFLDDILPDLTCFQTFVQPSWTEKFIRHDAIQRRRLASFQTGGQALVESTLQSYLV